MAQADRFGTIPIAQNQGKPGKKHRKSFKGRYLVGACVLIFCLFSLAAFFLRPSAVNNLLTLQRSMARIVDNRYHELYGAPVILRYGATMSAEELEEKFVELHYVKARDGLVQKPGTWAMQGNRVQLVPRGEGYRRPVTLELDDDKLQLIYGSGSGVLLRQLDLGRPLLTSFSKQIWELRYPVSFEQIPNTLVQAILAAEDLRFFEHFGLDPRGICRAALVNFKEGRVVQGGSTITQQLVKSLINRKGRQLGAKLEEAAYSLLLELFYTKQEIFTAYCNTIYLGQLGPFAVHGLAAAARHLLGRQLQELTPGDCALLAGLICSPNGLSPKNHPEAARSRAGVIAARMRDLGMTTGPVILPGAYCFMVQQPGLMARCWYYDAVQAEIEERAGRLGGQTTGSFYLGMDPRLQAAAQAQLLERLEQLDRRVSGPSQQKLQGAVVALDVETGAVRALVGGRDFVKSGFDRARHARRQIGSLIKPFVYLLAMQDDPENLASFPLREVADRPLVLKYDKRTWRPHNYDRRYVGSISLRKALVTSRNIPAVRVGEQVGLAPLAALLSELEVAWIQAPKPALYLGAVESSPLRMAAAYRTLASGGEYIRPYFLEGDARPAKKIFDPASTYVITDMLKGVLTEGTGRAAMHYKITAEAAGKTGTSSDLRDGWFAGYSPRLALVAWVGRDRGRPMGLTGATSSLQPWAALMQRFGGSEDDRFDAPAGLSLTGSHNIANIGEKPVQRKAAPQSIVPDRSKALMRESGAGTVLAYAPVALHRPAQKPAARQKTKRIYIMPAGQSPLAGQRYKYFE